MSYEEDFEHPLVLDKDDPWFKTIPTGAQARIKMMRKSRQKLDDLKDKKKRAQAEYDFLRYTSVTTAMEEEGLESIRLTGIGTCYLSTAIRASIVKTAKQQAYEWLRDNGHGGLIVETVYAQTLSSAAKEMLKNNESIPADLIVVAAITQAVIKKE